MINLTRALQINAVCEGILGLLLIVVPLQFVPGMTKNGTVVAQILGASLWALAATSWQATARVTNAAPYTALAHLLFHALGGGLLAFQVLQQHEQDDMFSFKMPLALHFGLTILILQSLISRTVKDAV
jgi:DMSO reductase anchor subunit